LYFDFSKIDSVECMEVGAEGGGDKVYHGGLAGAVSANQKIDVFVEGQ
jgi:hypothetical protein